MMPMSSGGVVTFFFEDPAVEHSYKVYEWTILKSLLLRLPVPPVLLFFIWRLSSSPGFFLNNNNNNSAAVTHNSYKRSEHYDHGFGNALAVARLVYTGFLVVTTIHFEFFNRGVEVSRNSAVLEVCILITSFAIPIFFEYFLESPFTFCLPVVIISFQWLFLASTVFRHKEALLLLLVLGYSGHCIHIMEESTDAEVYPPAAAMVGTIVLFSLVSHIENLVNRKRYTRRSGLKKLHEVVQNELAQSEKIIASQVPRSVLHLIQNNDHMVERGFSSVLVASLVGVDRWSSSGGMTDAQVFEKLNSIFEELDECARQHNCVRIKTIGSSYVASCGVPVSGSLGSASLDAEAIIRLAGDVVATVHKFKERLNPTLNNQGTNGKSGAAAAPAADWLTHQQDSPSSSSSSSISSKQAALPLSVCVGVSSGVVAGGILGDTNVGYELWGDAVRVAHTLATLPLDGEILLTNETKRLAAGLFKLKKHTVGSGFRSQDVTLPKTVFLLLEAKETRSIWKRGDRTKPKPPPEPEDYVSDDEWSIVTSLHSSGSFHNSGSVTISGDTSDLMSSPSTLSTSSGVTAGTDGGGNIPVSSIPWLPAGLSREVTSTEQKLGGSGRRPTNTDIHVVGQVAITRPDVEGMTIPGVVGGGAGGGGG